jgi:lipoprotein-anchoring transpeptidase ErfK/SrfK
MHETNGLPSADSEIPPAGKTINGTDSGPDRAEIGPGKDKAQPIAVSGWRGFWLAVIAAGIGLALLVLLLTTEIREVWATGAVWIMPLPKNDSTAVKKSKNLKKFEYEVAALRRAFDRLTPRQPYLVVSSSDNEFQIRNGKKELHHGVCSTGSFILLKAADKRQWIFQTPRGMYRVQVKVEAPVWRMPDWAFIEEGLPVPPSNSSERYEYGVLGEYALAFGNGYLVHGTLYQRFLGMPVTHGCIRLGDEDLREVYQAMDLGSKIFIY